MARRKRIPINMSGDVFRSEDIPAERYISPHNHATEHKDVLVRFERYFTGGTNTTTDVLMVVTNKEHLVLDVFMGQTKAQVERMADTQAGLLIRLMGFYTKDELMERRLSYSTRT